MQVTEKDKKIAKLMANIERLKQHFPFILKQMKQVKLELKKQ
jgi:hypothetical protein